MKLNEYRPNDEVDYFISKWSIEYCTNGEDWNKLQSSDYRQGLLGLWYQQNYGESMGDINVEKWASIDEAIKDDFPIPPEKEFVSNTLEHLKNQNYRYAVLECIICLEIVLNQYIRLFLEVNHSLSKSRIEKFLEPSFGLTSKISALLNLCLNKNEIDKVELSKVIQTIKWRNFITHRTGQLPTNIDNSNFNEAIHNTLSLIYLLASKRDTLQLTPLHLEISQKIKNSFGIPKPHITPNGVHRKVVKINYIFEENLPDASLMNDIVNFLTQLFTSDDVAFDPNKHLFIIVKTINKTHAIWGSGRLVMY